MACREASSPIVHTCGTVPRKGGLGAIRNYFPDELIPTELYGLAKHAPIVALVVDIPPMNKVSSMALHSSVPGQSLIYFGLKIRSVSHVGYFFTGVDFIPAGLSRSAVEITGKTTPSRIVFKQRV